MNDNSIDQTEKIARELARANPAVRCLSSHPPNGFGFAVRRGLADFRGDAVAICMADGSDASTDLVAFCASSRRVMIAYSASRLSRGGCTEGYPMLKLALNRLGNRFIQLPFRIPCDDISNAFKMYRRNVIAGIQPLLARHFNLAVEFPLKSIVRGYRYAVVPNTWINCPTRSLELPTNARNPAPVWLRRYLDGPDRLWVLTVLCEEGACCCGS